MKTILAAVVLSLSVIPALANEVLPFIENDFARAVARQVFALDAATGRLRPRGVWRRFFGRGQTRV